MTHAIPCVFRVCGEREEAEVCLVVENMAATHGDLPERDLLIT